MKKKIAEVTIKKIMLLMQESQLNNCTTSKLYYEREVCRDGFPSASAADTGATEFTFMLFCASCQQQQRKNKYQTIYLLEFLLHKRNKVNFYIMGTMLNEIIMMIFSKKNEQIELIKHKNDLIFQLKIIMQ